MAIHLSPVCIKDLSCALCLKPHECVFLTDLGIFCCRFIRSRRRQLSSVTGRLLVRKPTLRPVTTRPWEQNAYQKNHLLQSLEYWIPSSLRTDADCRYLGFTRSIRSDYIASRRGKDLLPRCLAPLNPSCLFSPLYPLIPPATLSKASPLPLRIVWGPLEPFKATARPTAVTFTTITVPTSLLRISVVTNLTNDI